MVNLNMLNLIASAIENGVQDMHSLEAAYRYISQGVEESSVKKPILTTSDGHSSRFSHPGLSFLLSNSNGLDMFLGPPGLTKLLDQINLYSQYQKSKKKLFTNEMTLTGHNSWQYWLTSAHHGRHQKASKSMVRSLIYL